MLLIGADVAGCNLFGAPVADVPDARSLSIAALVTGVAADPEGAGRDGAGHLCRLLPYHRGADPFADAVAVGRAAGLAGRANEAGPGFRGLMPAHVAVLILPGMIRDSASILRIAVPPMLPVVQPMGFAPVRFGILTVMAVEVGRLMPPFGISVHPIESTRADRSITPATLWLTECGARATGTDARSPGRAFLHTVRQLAETHDPAIIREGHRASMVRGSCGLGKLANLDALQDHIFTAACFPVRLRGRFGGLHPRGRDPRGLPMARAKAIIRCAVTGAVVSRSTGGSIHPTFEPRLAPAARRG
jgi:hypothetical protein